jgi:hypothetical protein
VKYKAFGNMLLPNEHDVVATYSAESKEQTRSARFPAAHHEGVMMARVSQRSEGLERSEGSERSGVSIVRFLGHACCEARVSKKLLSKSHGRF